MQIYPYFINISIFILYCEDVWMCIQKSCSDGDEKNCNEKLQGKQKQVRKSCLDKNLE